MGNALPPVNGSQVCQVLLLNGGGGKPASELTEADKGTAIATFQKGADGQWHYVGDADGHKNSGTFMGPSTKGTFWMTDQWPAQKPVTTWNVGNTSSNASMNANSYRVIIVPDPSVK
jgi:hypothetical protein